MSIPSRPSRHQEQGATRCAPWGTDLRWLSCMNYVFAMGIDKSTLGRKRPSGCTIRTKTGDKSGGTTIQQNANVARVFYGVSVAQHVPGELGVASPAYIAGRLRLGRAVALAGCAGELVGTQYRSTGGHVNHGVLLGQGRSYSVGGDGYTRPASVEVWDPAADGLAHAWGRADQGPSWWPWSLVLRFAAGLHPSGLTGGAKLGPGRMYAGVFPDTEPHAHLRYTGSVKLSSLPTDLIVRSPVAGRPINVRKGPSTAYAVTSTLATGKHFAAYQRTDQGQLLAGSRRWYGNHDGTRWVHSSGVRTA